MISLSKKLRILAFEIRRFLHNLVFSPKAVFCNNIDCDKSWLKNVSFHIAQGSRVVIEDSILSGCSIKLLSRNCILHIGKGSRIKNTRFYCEDDGSRIIALQNLTIGGGEIAATEGRTIAIGNDCMFSEDIEIRNGDSHSILSIGTDMIRINHAQDVRIGNHVWIAAHARVLKGATVPDDSIVANSSVVSSKFDQQHSIYGGNPARLIKSGVTWDRSRYNI